MNDDVPPTTAMAPGGDAAFLAAYAQLRVLAHQMFAEERTGHTLQATALVNEAYVRLQACGSDTVGDPVRYRRAAAQAMRRILIEHARSRNRLKRGKGVLPTSLDSVALAASGDLEQVLAIDDAIETMARDAPAFAELVRLRFYAGLDVAAAAEALGKPERTVQREWTYAKARLFQLLGGGD